MRGGLATDGYGHLRVPLPAQTESPAECSPPQIPGGDWAPEDVVAQSGDAHGDYARTRRPPRNLRRPEVIAMLDVIYILVGVLFFAGCVAFTRACEKL
jgi:hypothetical protein